MIKYKTLRAGARWIHKERGTQCHIVCLCNECSTSPDMPEIVVYNDGAYRAKNPITFIREYEFLGYDDEEDV